MTFEELIEHHKITVTSEYQPYRPEELTHRTAFDTPMRWDTTISVLGRYRHNATYSMGSGHCRYPAIIDHTKIPQHVPFQRNQGFERTLMVEFYLGRLMGDKLNSPPCLEKPPYNKYSMQRALKNLPQPAPDPLEIIWSLLQDGHAVVGLEPGEFMREFGYTDFDEGFKIYQACDQVQRFWVRAVGLGGFEDLVQAAWTWDEER